jgi:hypothetical protein
LLRLAEQSRAQAANPGNRDKKKTSPLMLVKGIGARWTVGILLLTRVAGASPDASIVDLVLPADPIAVPASTATMWEIQTGESASTGGRSPTRITKDDDRPGTSGVIMAGW